MRGLTATEERIKVRRQNRMVDRILREVRAIRLKQFESVQAVVAELIHRAGGREAICAVLTNRHTMGEKLTPGDFEAYFKDKPLALELVRECVEEDPENADIHIARAIVARLVRQALIRTLHPPEPYPDDDA